MRSHLPATAFALVSLVVLGCGSNQPPATVYVTVPQTVSRPVEGSGSKATVASEKKGAEKAVDEKAERVRKIDAEAMKAVRRGDLKEGMLTWSQVAKDYRKASSANCSPEEALAVATVYARICYLMAKQPDDEVKTAYVMAANSFARRGGITEEQYDKWYKSVLMETKDAAEPK